MKKEDIDILYKQIGNRLRQLRKNHKLNQEEFAGIVNLSRVSIANIESGKQRPTPHLLYYLSLHFDINIVDLFPERHSYLDGKAQSLEDKDRETFENLKELLEH